MKISFCISAVVLWLARLVFSSSIQVGTVLFSKTDLAKRCWSESDKSLLRARFIMQDVLPDPECIDFSKPGAIMILLEYFQFCYDIINRSCYGKVQNMMFLALSDAFGGYLRSYILPLTKRAYYAGQVKYSEAKKLFQLYDDIRVYLKTNGMGWAKPAKLCETRLRLKPLSINTAGEEEACDQLYIIENKSQENLINPNFEKEDFNKLDEKNSKRLQGNDKVSKRDVKVQNLKGLDELSDSKTVKSNFSRDSRLAENPPLLEKSKNFKERLRYLQKLNKQSSRQNYFRKNMMVNEKSAGTQKVVQESRRYRCECENQNDESSESSKKTVIPLPVMDDSATPHTIAVPFKTRPLRSLQTPSSAFLLEHYYSTVVRCLVSKRNTNSDIRNFNTIFHSWLKAEVLPHLSDEEWYPAFGGVLRILETIKKSGIRPLDEESKPRDIGFIFSKGFDINERHNCRQKGKERVRDVGDFENQATSVKRNYVLAILIITTTGVFSFCACVFYLQARKSRRDYAPSTNNNMNEKFINLAFLVRFFKKKEKSQEELEECNDNDDSITDLSHQWNKSYSSTNLKFREKATNRYGYDDRSLKEDTREKNESKLKGQLVVTGGRDVPAFIISNVETPQPRFDSSMHPIRTFQTPIIHFEKVGPSNVEIPAENKSKIKNVSPTKNFYEKVETIWKKPSAKFQKIARKEKKGDSKLNKISQEQKRMAEKKFSKVTSSEPCSISVEDEKKDCSTEKRSTSGSYSGTCSHMNETKTFSSSKVQGNEKSSSDTMKFFRKVMAKHKPLTKRPVQETTEETNSEGDSSYSSETDY